MTKMYSPVNGYYLDTSDRTNVRAVDAVNNIEQSHRQSLFLFYNVDDWTFTDIVDPSELSAFVHTEHLLVRSVLDIQACLFCNNGNIRTPILEEQLSLELLSQVDERMTKGLKQEKVLSQLLVAPIELRGRVDELVALALSNGLGAIANLLSAFSDAQPMLSRITMHWLTLSESCFEGFEGGRQQLWVNCCERCINCRLVRATSNDALKNAFGALALALRSTTQRLVVARVAERLSNAVFPTDSTESDHAFKESEHRETQKSSWTKPSRNVSGYEAKDRALRQIEGIIKALEDGRDYQAQKYLQDLKELQHGDENAQHAIKSLCNVAQQCALLFRTDFERHCLESAFEIIPDDPWTLIQFGDHLKRVGDFDRAEQVFRRAFRTEQDRIARSAIADVAAQRGDYEGAIHQYKAIAGFDDDPVMRMAIADNLRRLGRLSEAYSEYEKLLGLANCFARAISGMAEVEKRRGNLQQSQALYNDLLSNEILEDQHMAIYRCNLVGILMRLGDLEEAYNQVDIAIQESPHFMRARILRASVLGLLDRSKEAIESIPNLVSPRAFGEWLHQYVRGLLLLNLDRFADAEKELRRNFDEKLTGPEGAHLLRLAAAVSFVRDRSTVHLAGQFLATDTGNSDPFTEYLTEVLKLHIASVEDDSVSIAESRLRLQQCKHIPSGRLLAAVEAISKKDWLAAFHAEVDSLLQLAA
jgi:tetratricopeptide (TPR) repeat protein